MRAENYLMTAAFSAFVGLGGSVACGDAFDRSEELHMHAGIGLELEDQRLAKNIGRPTNVDISKAKNLIGEYTPWFSSENPCSLDIVAINARLQSACDTVTTAEETDEQFQRLQHESGLNRKKEIYQKEQDDLTKQALIGTAAFWSGIIGMVILARAAGRRLRSY